MDCAENEGACMVEIRERDGKLESVCMGCKQIRACKAQKGKPKFYSRSHDLDHMTQAHDS